jgi:hypothetical protein
VANTYSFYQAKATRQSVAQMTADELAMQLKLTPNAPADARKLIEERIAALNLAVSRYQSEPETGDGKKELLAKAKDLETLRDQALRKSTYFGYGMITMQIAIVLATAALTANIAFLLVPAVLFSLLGMGVMFNGFTMMFELPFL